MTTAPEKTWFTMSVELGKIREFAEAAGSVLADYCTANAVIPPTFLVTSASWMPSECQPRLDFDHRRMLHGEQEYIFHGPLPCAGDVLRVAAYVAERSEKVGRRGGRMRTALIITEFTDPVTGALRVEQRTTMLETGGQTQSTAT